MQTQLFKKIAKNKNEYAICTESVGKTEGTTERSKWGPDAKARYSRCLKHIDPEEHIDPEKDKAIKK